MSNEWLRNKTEIYKDRGVNYDGIPVLPAEVRDHQFVVWCEYCQDIHRHGVPPGPIHVLQHRTAHCPLDKNTPYKQTGYYLVPVLFFEGPEVEGFDLMGADEILEPLGKHHKEPGNPFRDFHKWLEDGLAAASYIEEVQHLRFFVFHPRLNGCSNVCLLCGRGVFEDDGHADDCPYKLALERTSKDEPLQAYIDRQ